MHYAFEDRENLYLVIDLMAGGDLRYHIGRHKKFSEEQTSKRILLVANNQIQIRVLYCMHAALS